MAISRRARTCSSTGSSSKDAPDALAALAEVDMHAMQTSGTLIRNVTADHFSARGRDEIRIRASGGEGRAAMVDAPSGIQLPATQVQDRHHRSPTIARAVRCTMSLRLWRNEAGEVGFEVIVGGGLGRSRLIGKTLREFLPRRAAGLLEASCASTTATAGATTSTRRASRSWSTSRRREDAREVEAEFAENPGQRR